MTADYRLDPQAKAFLDAIADKPELCAFPPPRARELYAEMVRRVGGAPAPVLVYFHGGGWTVGDLDTHDPVCRWLS